MRRESVDLDVEHCGKPAQPLRADTQCIHFFVELDTQFFHLALRTTGQQLVHVDVVHERLLGHKHSFFCRTADTNTQHARRTPASTHLRHRFQYPVDQGIAWIQHDKLGLVLGTAPFCCHLDIDLVALNQLDIHDTGGVVARILAGKQRVVQDRRPQRVVGIQITLTHAFIANVLQAAPGVDTRAHANFQKHIHNPRVLTNRAMPFSAHAGIRQNLRDGIFCRRILLALICPCKVLNVIGRVVKTNELNRIGNRLDQVFFFDDGRHNERSG